MIRLLQVSDPHFGTEQAPVADALLALVRCLRPEVLVLSGDITQRARAKQFRDARAFVGKLGIPRWLALPGNHDIPLFNPFVRLLSPYGRYQRYFGAVLEPTLETDTLMLLGVNTTRPWRHKDGVVSDAQVARVAQRLRRARTRQLRVVVTHQPIHVYRDRDAHNLLHNHAAAAQAWAAAGADLVLGGHIHLPYVRPLRERMPELPRDLWCVQAGTALSSRIRLEAPNSINLIEYDPLSMPRQCAVQRWDYGAANRFTLTEITTIALDREAATA